MQKGYYILRRMTLVGWVHRKKLVGAAALLATLLVSSAGSAGDSAVHKPDGRRVAVVLSIKDPQAGSLTKAFEKELLAAGAKVPGLKLFAPRQPIAKFVACKTNLHCFATLGKAAGADTVLFARWAKGPHGAVLQHLLISTSTARIEHSGVLEVTASSAIAGLVASHIGDMVAISDPAMLHVVNLQERSVLIDAVPAQPLPAPASDFFSLAPGPHHIEISGVKTAFVAYPRQHLTVTAPPLPAADKAPALAAVTLPQPQLLAPKTEQKPAEESANSAPPQLASNLPSSPQAAAQIDAPPAHHRYALVAGIVVASVGVLGLGAGAYYGLHATSLRKSIVNGPTGTSQIQAESTNNSANNDARMANVLLAAGGAVATIGGVLIITDLLGVWSPQHDTPTVSLDAHGATLGYSWNL